MLLNISRQKSFKKKISDHEGNSACLSLRLLQFTILRRRSLSLYPASLPLLSTISSVYPFPPFSNVWQNVLHIYFRIKSCKEKEFLKWQSWNCWIIPAFVVPRRERQLKHSSLYQQYSKFKASFGYVRSY